MKLGKQPFIKWTGSKRKQAEEIVDMMPTHIGTYYEPFVGGGSVMHELLNRVIDGSMKVDRIVASDLNRELMDVWDILMNDPQSLLTYYTKHYETLLQMSGMKSDIDTMTSDHVKACQPYYYAERARFNAMEKSNPERPYLFYWLTRTCFNGLIRYNPKGHFNTPFHVAGRLGIKPEQLERVIEQWHDALSVIKDVKFLCKSYEEVINEAVQGDVVYLDPPYQNIGGMYFADAFDHDKMYDVLRDLNKRGVKWLLSYDGKSGKDDRTAKVPEDIFEEHMYIYSGHSSFKKLKSQSRKEGAMDDVFDSMYVNFDAKIPFN